MEKQGFSLNVLLIIDNGPGHPQNISIEDEDVEVVFLTPNTTSLLQPLGQGIISCGKDSHTCPVIDMVRAAIDADNKLQVMDCWKSFTIADAITLIEAAMDELKSETDSDCWKNLWIEAVNDFKGFTGINREVKKIIRTARGIGGESLADIIGEEVEELIKQHHEVLTNEELEDLVKSSTVEEKEIELGPAMWTMEKFGEVFWMEQNLKKK